MRDVGKSPQGQGGWRLGALRYSTLLAATARTPPLSHCTLASYTHVSWLIFGHTVLVSVGRCAATMGELRFLLVHHKVSDDIQAELFSNGINTVAKFAASATDEADLKKMLKDSFALEPSASLASRARAAGVTIAWRTANSRAERQAEAEATNEIRDCYRLHRYAPSLRCQVRRARGQAHPR